MACARGGFLVSRAVALWSFGRHAVGVSTQQTLYKRMASASPTLGKISSTVEMSMGLRPLGYGPASRMFQHNSWDGAEWTAEEHQDVQAAVRRQQAHCMPPEQSDHLLQTKQQSWNKFYNRHKEKFFKDRKWLCHELGPHIDEMKAARGGGPVHILEVGCGVGNAIYPLLEDRDDVTFSAFDFSESAVRSLQRDGRHDGDRMNSFVYDATAPFAENGHPTLTDHVVCGSIDIVLMLFSLSAIDQRHHIQVLRNLIPVMRPGAVILFRDYAMYDQSQLQLKDGRCIKDSLYARGDGTLVHYFTEQDVESLCTTVKGLKVESNETKNLLIVNRKKKKKMMRSWIQGLVRKIIT